MSVAEPAEQPINPEDTARAGDLETLRQAFEVFTRSTAAMEESYQRLEERVHTLDRELQQKNRLAALGEMAATVAHEIRNPLGGIRGFAALLERDLEGDERARHVERILEGVQILDRIVGELLDYTRPVELSRKRTEAAALVRGAMEYLPETPETVALELVDAPPVFVDADTATMRQALLNILINAVQSLDGNGRVSIAIDAEDTEALIRITDTGCGIDPEAQERIFNPFYTDREKGTGLGLAVARKIVEAHGGVIELDSEPGRGSTFTLRLPRTA